MNARTPIKSALEAPPFPVPAPKMRAKLRVAIDLIVAQGKSVKDAALGSGFNESALSRAINRPDIREYIDSQKALFCLEADKLKGYAKAAAIHTGLDLMRNSPSHAVRARMVELFAGEAKSGPSVAVQVNVDRGGYEFVRPGARMVEISPITDAPSGGDDSQAVEE